MATEIANSSEQNLYDFIQRTRPRWFQPRTPMGVQQSSIGEARGGVVVYLDDNRLGGAEVLRTISRSGVKEMRFYDVSAAQSKFPNRETTAVIQVITK